MPRWTPEARERQRQLIQTWKPWEHSAGPTSDYGKFVSSQNSPHCSEDWKQWQTIAPIVQQMKNTYQDCTSVTPTLAQRSDAIEVLKRILRSES